MGPLRRRRNGYIGLSIPMGGTKLRRLAVTRHHARSTSDPGLRLAHRGTRRASTVSGVADGILERICRAPRAHE